MIFEDKELDMGLLIKCFLDVGGVVTKTKSGEGGVYIKGKKLTDEELMDCIRNSGKDEVEAMEQWTNEELTIHKKVLRDRSVSTGINFTDCMKEYFPTKWGLEYTVEYPDISPVHQPFDDDCYERKTWGRIVWSFLESGRELMKITPPEEIDVTSARISLHSYLKCHPELPVYYASREKILGNDIYLFRTF